MGCCSSKVGYEDPPNYSPVQTPAALTSTNQRDNRPKPLPVVATLPPDAKNDSVAPNAATGTRLRLASTSHADETAKNLKKRKRLQSAPGDIPSYRKKTAINLCLEALNILNSTLSSLPIPGLSAAPMVLIDAIKRVQNMSSADEGWNALTVRLQHLTYLTDQVRKVHDIEDIVNSCLRPATAQLEKLAIEIEKAGKERKALQRFLTSNAENDSIASHDKVLDQLISELTSKLCMYTALTVREVRDELKHISKSLELGNGPGDLPVHGIEIRDNASANVRGSAFSNIQLVRGTSASMVGNTGINIGGDAFSNISFLDDRERTLSLPAPPMPSVASNCHQRMAIGEIVDM